MQTRAMAAVLSNTVGVSARGLALLLCARDDCGKGRSIFSRATENGPPLMTVPCVQASAQRSAGRLTGPRVILRSASSQPSRPFSRTYTPRNLQKVPAPRGWASPKHPESCKLAAFQLLHLSLSCLPPSLLLPPLQSSSLLLLPWLNCTVDERNPIRRDQHCDRNRIRQQTQRQRTQPKRWQVGRSRRLIISSVRGDRGNRTKGGEKPRNQQSGTAARGRERELLPTD